MSLLSWNCQGMGVALTVRALKDICKRYTPKLVFLIETRMVEKKLNKIRRSIHGFNNNFNVDPVGLSGGLALWWQDDVKLKVLESSKHFIHVFIEGGFGEHKGFYTFVYGAPRRQDRQEVWIKLSNLFHDPNAPWCCIGDFNEIRSNSEKEGGRVRSLRSFDDFENFIDEANLIDLGYKGPKFTWSNRQMDGDHIKERLDRALGNLTWRELYDKA